MTPAARLQAAIEILDRIVAGTPAEKALTTWARNSRYAGSKDRAAVRDHVFTAIRCRRSHAALGGGDTGRGLILGAFYERGEVPVDLFTGERYAPDVLTETERSLPSPDWNDATRLDMPDWLWPKFTNSLGVQSEAAAKAMRQRAPIHIRANLLKTSRDALQRALAAEGVTALVHPASDTALDVTEGARKLRNTDLFRDGHFEMQDAASQAVTDALPLKDGLRVLDYCAGGGGKTLSMAGRTQIRAFAHDVNFDRMKDLPDRADRAGIRVERLRTQELAAQHPFDVILCDAPCSGSGSWRRAPEGKWSLTSEKFDQILQLQQGILRDASQLVAPNGVLAYATCSMLVEENQNQITEFLQNAPDWELTKEHNWFVHNGTDGFFLAVLTRKS